VNQLWRHAASLNTECTGNITPISIVNKTVCRVILSIRIFEYFGGRIFESNFSNEFPALYMKQRQTESELIYSQIYIPHAIRTESLVYNHHLFIQSLIQHLFDVSWSCGFSRCVERQMRDYSRHAFCPIFSPGPRQIYRDHFVAGILRQIVAAPQPPSQPARLRRVSVYALDYRDLFHDFIRYVAFMALSFGDKRRPLLTEIITRKRSVKRWRMKINADVLAAAATTD